VEHSGRSAELNTCAWLLGWLGGSTDQAVGVELRKAVLAALDRELFVPEWLLEMVSLHELIPPQWLADAQAYRDTWSFEQTLEDAPE